MTKAEIISAVRAVVNEQSTDSGALLSDTGNLLEYINDAMEHVVLDLIPIMPGQFLTSETINLLAGTASYTLTTSFYMIYKVEKNVTSESPREIAIIDPLEIQYRMNVGDTDATPDCCYFLGDTIYFVPTPSAAKTAYAKVWLVRPEASTMATAGPSYIPAPAHRLIVYRAAALAAVMLEADPSKFMSLYALRLKAVRDVWANRFQQKPRFVREGIWERETIADREKAFYDVDFP